jgi:hypothetical protein
MKIPGMKNVIIGILFESLLCGYVSASPVSAVSADTIAPSFDDKWDIHFNYVFGYNLLPSEWAPAQHQVEFGLLDVDLGKRGWPFSLSARLLLSTSPVIPRLPNIVGDYCGTGELSIGIRKVIGYPGRFLPFAGAGVGLMGAGTTTRVDRGIYYQETNRSGVGLWGNAGCYWILSDSWHTGLSFDYSRANITLFDNPMTVGGFHLLLYIGYHW